MATNDFAEVRKRSILARKMWAAWQSELVERDAQIAEMRRLVKHSRDGHLCAGYKCVDPECADCQTISSIATELELTEANT